MDLLQMIRRLGALILTVFLRLRIKYYDWDLIIAQLTTAGVLELRTDGTYHVGEWYRAFLFEKIYLPQNLPNEERERYINAILMYRQCSAGVSMFHPFVKKAINRKFLLT
jgi:hypothetical protein